MEDNDDRNCGEHLMLTYEYLLLDYRKYQTVPDLVPPLNIGARTNLTHTTVPINCTDNEAQLGGKSLANIIVFIVTVLS